MRPVQKKHQQSESYEKNAKLHDVFPGFKRFMRGKIPKDFSCEIVHPEPRRDPDGKYDDPRVCLLPGTLNNDT
jgi:hypothetical protein